MKINWGWGIGIFYSFFVIAMLSVVYMTTFNKPDMVSDDYYRDEQVFQKQIDKSVNAEELNVKVKIFVENSELKIIFPKDMNTISGNAVLFRPSDSKLDKTLILKENINEQSFDISKISKGKWTIKVNWINNDVEYYVEKNLFL